MNLGVILGAYSYLHISYIPMECSVNKELSHIFSFIYLAFQHHFRTILSFSISDKIVTQRGYINCPRKLN